MPYRASKTWGHDLGLSCCFRQWRAASHCRHLHGYALAIRVEFEAETLDERNWVMDFGALREVKAYLVAQFDHVLLVAQDDPAMVDLLRLHDLGLATVLIVPQVGCEAFAEMVAIYVSRWLVENAYAPRVRVHLVQVREHGANAASYHP